MKQKGKAVLGGSRWKNYLSFNSTSGNRLVPGQMAERVQKIKKKKNWEKKWQTRIKGWKYTSESAANTNAVFFSAWFPNAPLGICFLLFLILCECAALILLQH